MNCRHLYRVRADRRLRDSRHDPPERSSTPGNLLDDIRFVTVGGPEVASEPWHCRSCEPRMSDILRPEPGRSHGYGF